MIGRTQVAQRNHYCQIFAVPCAKLTPLLTTQPRKHLESITTINRLPHLLIHLILPKIPRESINTLPRRKREISPKKQTLRTSKLQQQIELVHVSAQSGIVIELLRIIRHLLARVGGQAGVRESGRDAGDEVGEIAVGVERILTVAVVHMVLCYHSCQSSLIISNR